MAVSGEFMTPSSSLLNQQIEGRPGLLQGLARHGILFPKSGEKAGPSGGFSATIGVMAMVVIENI